MPFSGQDSLFITPRGEVTLTGPNHPGIQWSLGAVPLSRDEIHDEVIEMMDKEPRGKVLDVPTGTDILEDRLRKMGFEVSCCHINPSFFLGSRFEGRGW